MNSVNFSKILASLTLPLILLSIGYSQTEVTITIPAAKDNTIYETGVGEGQRSNGIGDYIFTGIDGGEGGSRIKRSLLQFIIDDYVPAGAQITSVSLMLSMDRTNSGPMDVSIYALQRDWGEGTSNAGGGEGGGTFATDGDATWAYANYFANLPGTGLWTNAGGDFEVNSGASTTVDTIGLYTWGSSAAMVNSVQSWLENPETNFGWILIGDESGDITAKRYVSKDNADGGGPELSVTYLNQPPVAVNDTTQVNEDDADGVNFSILSNDYDPDGNIMGSTVHIVNGPINGSYTLFRGIINYIPDANFFGSDYITYTVNDNTGDTSNVAQVLIHVNPVNDAPLAINDTVSTNEDEDIVINILANDQDDHGFDFSSISITDGPSGGSITNINVSTGEVTYSPANDTFGTFSFSYQVDDDSSATSNEATVTIFVNSVNDNPFAEDDPAEVDEDSFITINILGNDGDTDGSLNLTSVNITSAAEFGTTQVNAISGQVRYVPDDDFFGMDFFTYTVRDDSGAVSNQALVSITVHSVNDIPVAVDDEAETDEETLIVIDVLNNDYDIENNMDSSTVSILAEPSHGTINSINSETGAISYTPSDNFNGMDSFSYTVLDDSGAISIEATVTVIVNAQNDSPVISEIPLQTFNEDDSLVISLQFLTNFVNDPDNADSSLIFTFSETHIISVHLTSENVTFNAPANWFGEDSVKVTVSDGLLEDSTMVYFYVRSVNDLPMFTNLPAEIEFDNSGSHQIELDNLATDNDLPFDSLRWAFSIGNDSVLFDYNSSAHTLTLSAPNFAGYAVLSFTVTDDSSGSITDSILIHVTGTVTGLALLPGSLPANYKIYQNFPNPFNPLTQIVFDLPKQERVRIAVYNIRGQKIEELVNRSMAAGRHQVSFDGKSISSGIYFYSIEAGSYREVKRMLLIK